MHLLRLVLADDNPEIIQVLKDLLQDDFTVAGTFLDGESVVREAAHIKPDVIVLDISLGKMSGFEVVESLRRKNCKAKIIFLTLHEQEEFVHAAFKAGVSGYVFKARLGMDLVFAIKAVSAGEVFLPFSSFPAGHDL